MRSLLFFFLFVAAAGVGFARYQEQSMRPQAQAADRPMAMAAAPMPVPAPPSNYRTVTLQGDGRGHFMTAARVDGRVIEFMVDTGASAIALRESSAARLGIHPSARDYSIRMQTANGVGKAARVRLDRVEIGGIVVRDVDALVVPDEALGMNLLGMTFLSRVKWSHDRGRLILEQ